VSLLRAEPLETDDQQASSMASMTMLQLAPCDTR
jgi:hypothetical protein